MLTAATRAAKEQLSHPRRPRPPLGHGPPSGCGFGGREVERLRTTPSRPEPASEGELRARLTEFDATFTEREARAVALEASAGLPIAECLKRLQDLRPSGDLLALAGGLLTTRAHRALERQTVQLATGLAASEAAVIPAGLVELEIARLDRQLSAEGAARFPRSSGGRSSWRAPIAGW